MAIYYDEILLDKLTFDQDTSTLILGGDDLTDTFSVSYIPNKVDEEFDTNDYELFLLENK